MSGEADQQIDRKAQELLVSRGITSVGAAVNRGFADDLRAYETLACDGRLRMRVNLMETIELGSGGVLVLPVFTEGRLRFVSCINAIRIYAK